MAVASGSGLVKLALGSSVITKAYLGGSLVYDSTAPGGGGGTPSPGIVDDFGRTDLGSDWTTAAVGNFDIVNGELAATTTFGGVARHRTAPSGPAIFSQIRWKSAPTATGLWAGPAVNLSPLAATLDATPSFYFMTVTGTTFQALSIRRKTDATSASTSLAATSLPASVVSGDVLRLESTATELIGYVNGTERLRVDKSVAALLTNPGATGVGVYSYGSIDGRLDDFQAGQIGAGDPITPPPAPVLAAATNVTSGSFTSTWSDIGADTTYRVERSTGGGAYSTVATVASESYTHTALAASTTYSVRIVAVRNGLESGPSNVVSATTTAAVTPGVPELNAATSISSSGFASSWSVAANATDYLVQRRVSGGTFATVATTTNRTYVHSGLSASTTYDVQIIARAGTVQSTPSNIVSTTTTAASTGTPPTGDRYLIGLTPAQLQAIPMSGSGWQNILTQSGSASTAVAVNMNDINSTAAGSAVCAGLRYARTGDVGYKNKVIAACEAVRNWSGATTYHAYYRQIMAYVIAADLVGHKTSAWVSFLDTVRYKNNYSSGHSRWGQMYTCAWDSANNHGAMAQASFLACSLIVGDDARIDEAVGWIWALTGDFTRHGTHPSEGSPTPGAFRPNAGCSLSWTWGTPWVPINPADAPATLEGCYNQDIARENTCYSVVNGAPRWGGAGQKYTTASACGFMTAAMLIRGTGLDNAIFSKGNNAFRRWRDYIGRYCAVNPEGPNPHPYPAITGWQDPLMNAVYGTNYATAATTSWNMTGTDWLGLSPNWLKG